MADTAVERIELETTDADRAQAAVRERYFSHRVRLLGHPRKIGYRQRSASAGELAVDTLRYTAAIQKLIEPIDYTLVAVFREGGVRFATAAEEVLTGPGDAVVYPQGTPFTATFHHVDVLVARLPTQRVAEVAAAGTGIDPAEFRFDGMPPVSAAMTQHWRRTMAYLHRLFEGTEPAVAHPLLHANAVEVAATAALAAFPNTAMSVPYARGAGSVAPAAIRRATAYMEAHAGEPITPADIAAAARLGVRGLQLAFRRHVGTTPTAHLRRVRLEHAHRELQAADPARGDTVAVIARRWGFGNPGRFATDYAAAYGLPPSRTLRT